MPDVFTIAFVVIAFFFVCLVASMVAVAVAASEDRRNGRGLDGLAHTTEIIRTGPTSDTPQH